MVFVMVLEPVADQSRNRFGIRQWRELDVIALEGLQESLRDPVALRASHRREAGLQADLAREDLGVPGDIR